MINVSKYWVGVVSQEHVLLGVDGGFCQVCSGKKGPLNRMKAGDGLVYYSPKVAMESKEICQKFTAIGRIADDNIYSFKMSDTFIPFRRNVIYFKDVKAQPIHPLLNQLSFTKGKTNWGAQFRFGFFEITQDDFEFINQKMTPKEPIKKTLGPKNKRVQEEYLLSPSSNKKTKLDAEISTSTISMDQEGGPMAIELEHTEFAKASPNAVWKLWSNVSTWSEWDHGIEWCKLKEGNKFELHGEASLLPKGAPFPIDVRIIECSPNKSFTDEGTFGLGTIHFTHQVQPEKDGVRITHTLKFVPSNPHTQEAFEKGMLPKLKMELPESVKALAKCAEYTERD